MKNQKKNTIIIVCFILILGLAWLLTTHRYIRSNIKTIDKADGVYIVNEGNLVFYPLDEEVLKLVSYAGFISKVDNLFVDFFAPYSNKLNKIDVNIRYTKGESTLATADVYQSNDNPEQYLLYMNNVYWSTNSKLIDLLELIE